MTASRAPRGNRGGHPCPPWCATDHEEVHGEAGTYRFHGGTAVRIEVPGEIRGVPDEIRARPVHDGTADGTPLVSVSGTRYGRSYGTGGADPHVWLGLRDAEDLAGLVEMLAAATPDQHRELAGAIRAATAVIAEVRAPEAGVAKR